MEAACRNHPIYARYLHRYLLSVEAWIPLTCMLTSPLRLDHLIYRERKGHPRIGPIVRSFKPGLGTFIHLYPYITRVG